MKARALFAVTVLTLAAPALAAGQEGGIGLSVHGAVGSHIGDGGDTESLSLGVSFGERFEVLVSGEHAYRPTRVTFFVDGYAATRGANTRFISGEFRYVILISRRTSPYIIAGIGRGTSRPNVDAVFPDQVTHDVMLQFPGAGVRVLITRHLRAFADARLMIQSRRGEPDAGIFMPVRGGLVWRF